MSITAGGGTIVVEFRPSGIHGAPMIGAYLMRYFLNYKMPAWEKSYRFSNARAKISVENGSRLLGYATPEVPFVLTSRPHHQEATVSFELVLNAHQLEALERVRLGGELTFVIDIYGEIFDEHNCDFRNERIHFPVNQKAWIDVLKDIGFSNGILVELPVSKAQNSTSLAWKAIERAKEHLYYGNYDEVVGSCRKALEDIRADGEEIAKARDAFVTTRREMSKRERLIYALDALEHYTHPAQHVEGLESYSRDDAIFILGAVISAVANSSRSK